MNIYVESFNPVIFDYEVFVHKLTESMFLDHQSPKYGSNWWYERAIDSQTEDVYYRLKINNKIEKGKIVFIYRSENSVEPQNKKIPIGYIMVNETVNIPLVPDEDYQSYPEPFNDGTWAKDIYTEDQLKELLAFDKLIIPYSIEGDAPYFADYVIDLSKIETDPSEYGNIIFKSIKQNDIHAVYKPFTFITEGIITDYISFQWNDKYYQEGNFNITLPANEENMSLLTEGRYVLIGESDKVMMIERVQFNNNLKTDGYIMQVSGRSIESILERRVAFPGQGLNTNECKGENGLIKAIYSLIDGFFINPEKVASESSDGEKFFYYPERKIPFLTIPDEEEWYYKDNEENKYIKRSFHEAVNKSVSKDNLLKIISELCKNTFLGFKIIPVKPFDYSDVMYWEFSLYTGEDKSYTRTDKEKPLLLFSPTLKNVESVSTTKDSTNYRNVIFCGVEKDSDGYINLSTNENEATGYGNKTGIDIIDKVNDFKSEATALITGAKNKLVTMLEASEICYTGIYILAVAASRKDKDYSATVTKIESTIEEGEGQSELYIAQDEYEEVVKKLMASEDGMTYLKGVTSAGARSGALSITIDENDYIEDTAIGHEEKIKFCRVILINTDKQTKIAFNYLYRDGNNDNRIGEAFNFNDPNGDIKRIYGEKGYISGKGDHSSWGNRVDPRIILCDYSGNWVERYIDPDTPQNSWPDTYAYHVADYDNKECMAIRARLVYKEQSQVNLCTDYPTSYVNKSTAENTIITIRKAFGDKDESSSNKTTTFRLSAVNSKIAEVIDPSANPPEKELDFKNSTAYGWLTTPILKQAINDLNNLNFNILQKSALQAWFKTFDKFTSTNSQKRWLCQEYVYDEDNEGLNRREVFVDENESDSNEWNASAINQFQSSTTTYSVDEQEDEESDEKINERLMESARKQSGNYRRQRDVDASLELDSFKYMSNEQNGYNLGDIIQVDDGWGNLDQYYISGITISNDTNAGLKILPQFEKFELIPKQYRQLDFIQVANMILPAKFNRKFSNEQDVAGVNIPSNVYFGTKNISGQDDKNLAKINRIKTEDIGVSTEIECTLEYIKKDQNTTKTPVFALISAIGSQQRLRNEQETRLNGINLPFALIDTSYSSPYYFMTKHNSSYVPSGNRRFIYMFMDNRVNIDDETYESGVGYKNMSSLNNISKCDFLCNRDRPTILPATLRTPYKYGKIEITQEIKNEEIGLTKNYYKTFLDEEPIERKVIINRLIKKNTLKRTIFNVNKNLPEYTIAQHKVVFKFPILANRFGYFIEGQQIPDEMALFCNINGRGTVVGPTNCIAYNENGTPDIRGSITIDENTKEIKLKYNGIYKDIYLKPDENSPYEFLKEPKKVKLKYYDTSLEMGLFVIEGIDDYFLFYGTPNTSDINIFDNTGSSQVADLPIIPEEEEYTNKEIYYSESFIDESVISDRPLTPGVYDENLQKSQFFDPIFINRASSILKFNNGYLLAHYPYEENNGVMSPINLLSKTINRVSKPTINENTVDVRIDNTWWGLDNYTNSEYYNEDEGYNVKYNYLLYENNIVLGGCGVYIYDTRDGSSNFKLKFYQYDTPQDLEHPLADASPKACDTNNGVRITGSIKIYETIMASRKIDFDTKHRICRQYNDATLTDKNDNDNKYYSYNIFQDENNDMLAYYPDLNTRKLVHEYVPVRYVEGGSDILKEEEYGLYDLVDKVFVPINWGGNEDATFIKAGGEINNE